MRLTKRVIDSISYQSSDLSHHGDERFVVRDTDPPGFGVRIDPSGRKAFVLSYRVAGRKRLLTIGTYGVLTLDQARTHARAALAKVETQDADPLADREKERQGETVADLCTAYMERHDNAKKSGGDDQRRIDRHILPKWGTRKAKAIAHAEVAALHAAIGRTAPYEANRTLALLSKMFDLARRWGFVPDGHPNPARDIDRFKEEKRDRWVSPAELPRLAEAINEEPNESARAALWLYLLTGARKQDVRLHDLRRTVGSWLAQAGNSLHLIGRVLNHSNQSTTAVYARFGEDSVRAALEQHGARIMGAAGITPSANVTDIKAKRTA